MMLFVPEDKVMHSPQWWNSERYDYCDKIIVEKNDTNLVNRIFRKFSQLFA